MAAVSMPSCVSTISVRAKASSSCASPRRCCVSPTRKPPDRLIADKIPSGDWEDHLGDSESLFVNASTWGLMLTGRLVDVDRAEMGSVRSWFSRLTSRLGEPVARSALRQAMRILGHQFVMGRDIEEALSEPAARASARIATPSTCWASPR